MINKFLTILLGLGFLLINLEFSNAQNPFNHSGPTPLMIAAMKGDLNLINKLLDQKVNINAKDNRGNSAVEYAALMKKDAAIDLLVKRGAKVGNVTEGGLTALIMAVNADSYSTVKKLIQLGWDPEVKTKNGQTPLAIAINEKRDSAAIAILANSANLEKCLCRDVKDYDVNRYIALAKKMYTESPELKELPKLVEGLEDYKMVPDYKATCSKTTHTRVKSFFPRAAQ